MNVSLRPFAETDIRTTAEWESAIHLDTFMSRSTPVQFNGVVDQSNSEYRWCVIVVDGEDAGVIWLEKEPGETGVARLGIFLANESWCGKGVGRAAIAQAIQECRAFLGFDRVRLSVRVNNARAIACYRACGFGQVGRGLKTVNAAKIEFLTLERAFAPS